MYFKYLQTKGSLAYWKFWKEKSDESKKYDLSNINDERIKRIFHIISIYGEIVTNQTQLKKVCDNLYMKYIP